MSEHAAAKRGRKPKGAQAMTPAERARASRARRTVPHDGEYRGKQMSFILNGKAHLALQYLQDINSDLSQKEIIEKALLSLLKAEIGLSL